MRFFWGFFFDTARSTEGHFVNCRQLTQKVQLLGNEAIPSFLLVNPLLTKQKPRLISHDYQSYAQILINHWPSMIGCDWLWYDAQLLRVAGSVAAWHPPPSTCLQQSGAAERQYQVAASQGRVRGGDWRLWGPRSCYRMLLAVVMFTSFTRQWSWFPSGYHIKCHLLCNNGSLSVGHAKRKDRFPIMFHDRIYVQPLRLNGCRGC